MIDTDFERDGREFEQNCLYAAAIARLQTELEQERKRVDFLIQRSGYNVYGLAAREEIDKDMARGGK